MTQVVQFPKHLIRKIPRTVLVPADYTLMMAVEALTTQCGEINALNKIIDAAVRLKSKIDAKEQAMNDQ